MRKPDQTPLPLVEAFGEDLERAIAGRSGLRRAQRHFVAVVCAVALVAGLLLSAPGRAATGIVGEWLGLADPGDPATVDVPRPRGNLHKLPTSSVVLAAGRAPDGSRYEWVLDSFAEPAKSDPLNESSYCLNLEWPDLRTGQIFAFACYPELPPADVDKDVIKAGGTIFDPGYTSHVQIAGVARSDVSDVQILYENEHGARREAPVHLASVTGKAQQRIGADRSFGVFVGFLPQTWLGYGANYDPRTCPPEEHPLDAEAIEVIAYDQRGKPIAKEARSNLISSQGRPSCP